MELSTAFLGLPVHSLHTQRPVVPNGEVQLNHSTPARALKNAKIALRSTGV